MRVERPKFCGAHLGFGVTRGEFGGHGENKCLLIGRCQKPRRSAGVRRIHRQHRQLQEEHCGTGSDFVTWYVFIILPPKVPGPRKARSRSFASA